MKKFMSATIIGLAFAIATHAATGGGTWYKPFDANVYRNVSKTMGAGNCIWFMSERGVGQLRTDTKKIRHFSFSSMGIHPFTDFDFVAGDSGHVTLSLAMDTLVFLVQYDGISWKQIKSPYIYNPNINNIGITVTANPRGTVWVCDGLNSTVFDGKQWRLFETDNSLPRQVYMVDDSGGLLLGCGIGQSDSTAICRFSGTAMRTVAMIGESPTNLAVMIRDVRGAFWIAGQSSLYKLDAGGTVSEYTVGETALAASWPSNLAIDANGDLWNTIYEDDPDGGGKLQLIKMDLNSLQLFRVAALNNYTSLMACGDGIYLHNEYELALRFYNGHGTADSVITLTSGGNACGNLWGDEIFRGDGSILGFDYLGEEGLRIIEYSNGACTPHSTSWTGVFECLLLRPDGSLLGSSTYTIYMLDGISWKPYLETENFEILQMVQDDSGKIWGVEEEHLVPMRRSFKIVHQTDRGWELFDSSNSNLSVNPLWSGNLPQLFKGSDGGVWLRTDSSSVARTVDGYNWIYFKPDNSNLPADRINRMYADHAGDIVLLYLAGCSRTADQQWSYDTCSAVIRAEFNGAGWTLDTVVPPVNVSNSQTYFEDGRGDLWIDDRRYDLSTLSFTGSFYRHAGSTWMKYDSSNTSFQLANIIGEDANGKIYFNDVFNETVVFDPSGIGISPAMKHSPSKSAPLRCRALSGSISVDYTLSQPGEATLSLYTLQGRLVKTIASGRQAEGAHHGIFSVNCAPGIYFVRLSAPDGSQGAKIMLR